MTATNTKSTELTAIDAGTRYDAAQVSSKVRMSVATIALGSQDVASTIEVARLKKGEMFLMGIVCTSVSLDTAKIKIGNATTADKYRADAVLTALTPEVFGKASGVAVLTADESVLITVGTAALPASGTVKVIIFSSTNS